VAGAGSSLGWSTPASTADTPLEASMRHICRWRQNRPGTLRILSPAALQDIRDNLGCICNMLEIAEESGTAGGNPKVALQAQQLNSLLVFMRASRARACAAARLAGTCSPRPKYISSGVCPAKAAWGTTVLCCSTYYAEHPIMPNGMAAPDEGVLVERGIIRALGGRPTGHRRVGSGRAWHPRARCGRAHAPWWRGRRPGTSVWSRRTRAPR